MAGGNRNRYKSADGTYRPYGQGLGAPQRMGFAQPEDQPFDLLQALQALTEAGKSAYNGVQDWSAKAQADPGNQMSPFGALPTQFMKDQGGALIRDWGGVKPAIEAGKDAITLADILSGKEKSVPFAPAYAGQKATDATLNAGQAAMDASVWAPLAPSALKSGWKSLQVEPPAGYASTTRVTGPSVKAANDDTLLNALRQAMTPAKEDYGAVPGIMRKNTDGTLYGDNKPLANDVDGYSGALNQQLADPSAPYLFEGKPLVDGSGNRAFDVESIPGTGKGAEPPQITPDSWGKIWLQRYGGPEQAIQHAIDKGRPDVAQTIQGWLNNGQLRQANKTDMRAMSLESALEQQKNPRLGTSADVLPFRKPPTDTTTLGMGFPFSGKDGERNLVQILSDALKGKKAPANPLDQFTPPTSLDDIFTGGSPRGPREITGGSQNPGAMEGSFFHDPRFAGPQDAVPYTEGQGFGGLDARLGKPKGPTELGAGMPADDLLKLLASYGAFGGMSAGALATLEAQKQAKKPGM